MDYQKVYDQLIQKNHTFSEGEYFETHHKVPKCMGGTDDANNLVNLTAREHYIAHLLLVKITETGSNVQAHEKMLYAFNCMKWGRCKGERSFKFNSRLYQKVKQRYSNLRRNLMCNEANPMKGKIWIHSDELKKSKIWSKEVPIPSGWKVGRKITFQDNDKEKHRKLQERLLRDETYRIKLERKLQREKQRKELPEMFREFKENEFDGVVRKFGYNHTRNALIMMFKKYIPEYVPQECNRWKNRNK